MSDRIAGLEGQARQVESRLSEIEAEIADIDRDTVDPADLANALSLFDPIWDVLFPAERARIIQLLVERVEHDETAGKLAIEFAPSGIQALAGEVEEAKEAMA